MARSKGMGGGPSMAYEKPRAGAKAILRRLWRYLYHYKWLLAAAVALGAGVPVLFFLIRMLANMGGRLEKLKYATVFTLFDPTGLFRGDGAAYAGAAVLLALGLGFYALGTAVFSRRDLPL